MRQVHITIIVTAATIALAFVTRPALPDPPPAPPTPIRLDEIANRGVAGRLGAPLGTIVTVSGEAVPNSSRSKKLAVDPIFLRIMKVDGKQLESPIDYPLVAHASESKMVLKVGERFRLVGYETGSFEGAPKGVFKYVEPYATTGFGFRMSFIVLTGK